MMKERILKFIRVAKKIPQKKHHLDFITAALSIPVLLSVIFLNYSNLQQNTKNTPLITPTQAPITTQTEKIIVVPQNSKDSNNQLITPAQTQTCIKDIGPISISSPSEGQTITDNPVCINIKYSDANYCSVVWSYRINNGTWSDFSSNNPCIYNLSNSNVKFDLRVQSTVIQKEENLSRNFIYKNSQLSPTPSASSSATIQ